MREMRFDHKVVLFGYQSMAKRGLCVKPGIAPSYCGVFLTEGAAAMPYALPIIQVFKILS